MPIVAGGRTTHTTLECRNVVDSLRFYCEKVFSATHQHGSYSFYLQDPDTNWWELELWEDAISPVQRGLERSKPSPA